MQSLLDRIEQDAREKLPLPPGRKPSEEILRYKQFLKRQNARLYMFHKGGGGGRELCRARARMMDLLLQHILEAVEQNLPMGKGNVKPRYAVAAIGGYGRGELNPHSDIDILFLHPSDAVTMGKAKPFLSMLTEGLLYTLWDLGFKVGHSVRSPEDCVKIANQDMQSKTSLIEARKIMGDEALFDQAMKLVIAKTVRGFEEAYIQARLEDQATRRAKYGNSACMQEPNVKNGCGGLRDFQNLLWMAFFKCRAQSLADLRKAEYINESEAKQLENAYDFLLRVRNELHYECKRPVDVISKNLQPTMATHFGYNDRSPSRRLEQFMRDLYINMRTIYLLTKTLEQRMAIVPQRSRIPNFRAIFSRRRPADDQVVDGFKIVSGELHAASSKIFRDQPRRMMRAFLHAQQRGLRLHPDLAQLMRNDLRVVNREMLKDEHVHQTFLEILNQRGNVSPIVRTMHEVGFLGKYLPEFGRLTCLVQHEFYHQYAADEHTLFCLEKLDRVWEAKEPPFSNYSELFQGIERPFVLYLALLLHDAGKAEHTRNHAEVGSSLALKVAKRLGLDGATTHALCLIVEQHLAMAQISQRRDLEDSSVIQAFAAQVQTRENLAMLTLHTFADSMGTSDQLWNGFKDALLLNLHKKAMVVLAGGTEFIRAEEKQIELLREEVQRMLPATFSQEEVDAHFEHLPPRYFHIHSAKEIVSDLVMAHRFMHLQLEEEDKALSPIVTWHNDPDRGYASLHICTWDRAGLFSKITGSLTAAGLNILSAQIFSRNDGIILDTFFVTDAKTGALPNRPEKEKFEKIFENSLTGEVDFHQLIAKQTQRPPLYKSLEGERLPTVVRLDNESSPRATVIDIETEDRVGLLYMISEAMTEMDLNISLAKIGTERGAAIDTFYVTRSDGEKVEDRHHLDFIRSELRSAIASLG